MTHPDFSKMNGLIPAIIQDIETSEVLMLGYMNKEAYAKTLETGLVTFYSRTRQCLWQKGESSGNVLKVESMHLDCDQDTLLIMTTPAGPTCHKGTVTCFGDKPHPALVMIGRLSRIIEDRKNSEKEKSYTKSLFDSGTKRIAQKVGEEATETVIAAVSKDKEALIEEASDLVYHLQVLLADCGISLSDIGRKLEERHER